MQRIHYAVDERDGVFFRSEVAAAVAKKSLEQRPVAGVNRDVAALYN
jgi:phosphopantothenate synthetase